MTHWLGCSAILIQFGRSREHWPRPYIVSASKCGCLYLSLLPDLLPFSSRGDATLPKTAVARFILIPGVTDMPMVKSHAKGQKVTKAMVPTQ